MTVARISKIGFIVLALCVAAAFQAAAAKQRDDRVNTDVVSWKALQHVAINDQQIFLDEKELLSLPQYARLMNSGSRPMLLEMAAQESYPSVMLAGFYGLKSRFPEDATRMAITTIAAARNPALPQFGPLLAEVSSIPDDAPVEILAPALSAPYELPGREMLVHALPSNVLDRWFHSQDIAQTRPTSIALVLDELIRRYAASGKQPTERMMSMLKSFKDVPGAARQLFVFRWPHEDDADFRQALKLVLMDEEVDELSFHLIVAARESFLRSHAHSLGLSEEQLSRVRAVLQERE